MQGDYRYREANPNDPDGGHAYWQFLGYDDGTRFGDLQATRAEIFATWVPIGSGATPAFYHVYDGNHDTGQRIGKVEVDLNVPPPGDESPEPDDHPWKSLGVFPIGSGELFEHGLTVELSDYDYDSQSCRFSDLVADAVMVRPLWPRLDLATDSDNDGSLDPTPHGPDDRVEMASPGRIVGVNDSDHGAEVIVNLDPNGYELGGSKLQLDFEGDGSLITVWNAPTGGTQIFSGHQWTIGSDTFPLSVFVEGGMEIEEEVEMFPGGFVEVNNDDDDHTVDNEDSVVEGDDNDLVPLWLHRFAPGGSVGDYTLSFTSGKIRIWENPDRTAEVVPDVTLFDAGADTLVYVEGADWPEGPSSEEITLKWGINDQGFQTQDEVTMHVVEVEFLHYNFLTEELYWPDVFPAGDARPEVSLTVTDAEITTDGTLQVTVQGTVTDRLSELADDPVDRVQRLDFWANSEAVGSIGDLPSLAAGESDLPWVPYPFSVDFERTFEFALPGRVYVIRAETTPNAAGVTGWKLVGVNIDYEDVTENYEGMDLEQLWDETPPTVDPNTGRKLQSRRYLPSETFPPGSFIVHAAGDEGPKIWAPGQIHATELGGSVKKYEG